MTAPTTRYRSADYLASKVAMPDLTIPLISATTFIGVGWLIVHAGQDYADAIRHTLSIFALTIGMIVLCGVMAKLHSSQSLRRVMQRVEARSQVDPVIPRLPIPAARGVLQQ